MYRVMMSTEDQAVSGLKVPTLLAIAPFIMLWKLLLILVADESLDLDSLLIKLHSRIDTQWYALGIAIGIPTEVLDSLKSYPDQECMVEMLDYWLRHHPDQPTWKEIADAIEDIHDYNLARSIKGVYDLPSEHTAFCWD